MQLGHLRFPRLKQFAGFCFEFLLTDILTITIPITGWSLSGPKIHKEESVLDLAYLPVSEWRM